MKVFISWSGDLSNAVAQVLKKYLPCIIQNADVFCSSEDIEKGENWDIRLTTELASSCFGIICLTPNNLNASWINFEAGAIVKTLDSRLTALLINLKPSDIQGPLKRYQATNIDERDMRKLVADINKSSGNTISDEVLTVTFDAIWPQVKEAISEAEKTYSKGEEVKKNDPKSRSDTAIQEILQLSRKQSVLTSSIENLLERIYSPLRAYSEPYYENNNTIVQGEQLLEIINYANSRIKKVLIRSKSSDSIRGTDSETDLLMASDILSDAARILSQSNLFRPGITRETRNIIPPPANRRKQVIDAECKDFNEIKDV